MKLLIKIIIFSLFFINKSYGAKIISSLKPIDSLIKMIALDSDEVLLASKNHSPHHYNFKISDIKIIEDADIIFYIDKEFESSFIKSIRINKKAKKIELIKAKGLKIYKKRSQRNWKSIKTNLKEKNIDEHIWLDKNNAKIMLKIIRNALIKNSPENKATYKRKYNIAIQKINILFKEIELELENLEDKEFIVFHDAFQYFEKQFSLRNIGQITDNPHLNISIKSLKKNRTKARERKVKCVFFEPQFNKKFTNIVTKSSKARIVKIDPIGYNLEPSADLYIKLLKNISRSYKDCLS